VFDQIGIPIIGETGGKLAQDPDTFLDLPQEQTTAIAADRSAIKLGSNLSAFLGMKSEDKLATLCSHKAVLLRGRISFSSKELCHEATAFSYLIVRYSG